MTVIAEEFARWYEEKFAANAHVETAKRLWVREKLDVAWAGLRLNGCSEYLTRQTMDEVVDAMRMTGYRSEGGHLMAVSHRGFFGP